MSQQQTLEDNLNEITNYLGELTGTRIYAAIADPNGKILALNDRISPFKDMIETFVKMNFPYLEFGDHSIPMSGHSLVFFRTNNGMVALYSPKGRHGQLLSFKSKFNDFSPKIDDGIGEIPYDQELVRKSIVDKVPPKLEYKRYQWDIIPIFAIKLTGKEKLQINEAKILNKCDGKASIYEISEMTQINYTNVVKVLLKHHDAGWIKFPNFHPLTVSCPTCKTKRHVFLPKKVFENNPSGYIRMQLPPEGCDHSYVLFVNKDLKVTKQSIKFFTKFEEKIDFFNLSIKNLLNFLGQDLFSNIFYTLLFQKGMLIIDEAENVEVIGENLTRFLKKIFPNLEFGTDIQALSSTNYKKTWKKYKYRLIFDLPTNVVINEPFEKEKFEVISEMLNELQKHKDEQLQVLKLNQEFERLLLLTEPVIKKVESLKKVIVEADLIEQIREEFNLELRIEEIPLIKKLAKACFNVDISKKILSELAYAIW